MADIAFDRVTRRFGDALALDDVSFEIADNEFYCFFGPPLCGKSTILRLILGLDRPDSGRVLIGGRDVTDVGPAERDIAMVFQNLALFPHMTARENVGFPLVERGVAKADIAKRVDAVADKLHMAHILDKVPAKLSGGERQRVAIGRALVRDPVAYLMDDPISALDARLREETRVELKRIQREVGHTLVYVTHDQEEAMSVADRMAIMRDGRIEQVGAPTEIYARPATAWVASILGAPQINLLELEGERGGDTVATRDGALRLPAREVPAGAVRVGVRPESASMRAWDPAANGGSSGPASGPPSGTPRRVSGVEPLGGFTIVSLAALEDRPGEVSTARGDELRLLLRGQPDVTLDQRVSVSMESRDALYFDADGRALPARDVSTATGARAGGAA